MMSGFFIYSLYLAPKPLGEQLQLIDRKYFGYLPIDDSAFSVDYYYATDMSLEEFTTYFKNAILTEPPQQELGTYRVRFSNPKTRERFSLVYYNHQEALQKASMPNSKNLVIVPERYYDIAKSSL